jgi:hypothetical protein
VAAAEEVDLTDTGPSSLHDEVAVRMAAVQRLAPFETNWCCPHDCPCDAPKQRLQSQHQPSPLIEEGKETEGFTRKIEDVRETDFRLANRYTGRFRSSLNISIQQD